MTIRSKLYLAVVALITVFVVALTVAMIAVVRHGEHTHEYARMREQSRFTSDIQTDIYLHLAAGAGAVTLPEAPEPTPWPQYALDDIEMQYRLAHEERERELWWNVHEAVAAIGPQDGDAPPTQSVAVAVESARVNLRALRMYYDLAESVSIATIAQTSLHAKIALGASGGLIILLFVAYLILVRDWLVRPIEILKASADAIGAGRLDHRVPLTGSDELAQLARRIDAMAQRLEQHQSELLEARELTAIGELCTTIAHGLRNPLAAMRASAQLAARRTDSDATRATIEELVEQADRMDTRITKLFELSRPRELRRDCTKFTDLAQAAQAHARPILDTRGVNLLVNDASGGTKWCLDREQVAEALGEIVTNAAHHSSEGGQIELSGDFEPSASGDADRFTLLVRDHGSGMAPVTIGKAFDMFFTGRPN